jgi:hypothetical protein
MEGRVERAQSYRQEARRYAELASSGRRDITTFVQKKLAERFAWMAEDLERQETANSIFARMNE